MQTVVARVRAKTEFIEAVRRECLALVEATRGEEGCLSYDLYQSTEDKALFVFYEKWATREDIERHLESPHSLAFDERTAGMLAEPEEILYLEKIS